jgi:23S rRNA (guanine1835-N2)-methyltransferase
MTRTPYRLTLESRVSESPPTYQFHTTDGVCSKQSFRMAELQLLESLWDTDLGDLLCPEANYGVIGTVLSETAGSVQMTESSARAVHLCEKNIRENTADASVTLLADLTDLDRRFDTVAYTPKPYTALPIGKQRIANALSTLRPGGNVYLSASKQTGLTRYEDCLRNIAATVECEDQNGEYQLLKATRPQTFDVPSYVSPRTIHPTVNGIDLSLVTVPGLFSASTLDDGTRLLIETTTIEDDERVLDLCCGYGAIGVYAAQVANCEIWLSDDDKVATTCTERSLQTSHTDGTVVTGDCVKGVVDQTFDRIFCNPPTHAGDGVLSELFTGVSDVLASDGQLSIVHHRELDLRDHLTHFGIIERCRTGEEHIVLNAVP